nr:OPT/YSL family transporter [Kofleriaceae bacterium]
MKLPEPLTQGGDPPPDATPVGLLGSDLDGKTIKTLFAGVVVAALMGASYPYMVLKLGFGPNLSVVAAFFGFLFLKLFDLGGTQHYDRWQNNLVEAAGTSAAQTAFMCILLGAFDILRAQTHGEFSMTLTPIESFLWLTCACTLGVLMAVPLRRHFIVDEKLPFVDGLAAAETLIVLDPPRAASAEVKRNAYAAFRAVMIGIAASAFVMLFRDDAKLLPIIPEGFDLPLDLVPGVAAASMGVGFSNSLLSVGSGMIVGFRVNLSMMIGGVLAWVVAPILLVKYGVPLHHDIAGVAGATDNSIVFTATPKRTEVLFWVMWPATGMLVAGGLTALALRWRLLVDTFRSLRKAKIGSGEFPLSAVVAGGLVSAIALCIVQYECLGMPVWVTIVAILLSIPLMLVGLRVLGETNWGPISALSNMMQGIFAMVTPGNILGNMAASGTTGSIATSSEAIMQDYRCGEIIGTKPRNITVMQLLAVPIGAAAVSWMYPALVNAFGIVDRVDPKTGGTIPPALTSPISNKWSGFAQILKEGISNLPTSAVWALVIFSVLGVVLTVLESNKELRKYIPSPTGIGIGILVPFNVVFTMFLGGCAGTIWERTNKKTADLYMIPLASGLIAGEALIAVFASIYLAAIGGGS